MTWRSALEKYQRQKDDLYAGREPRETTFTGHPISDLCNIFLHDKSVMVNNGGLTRRTWDDYLRSSQHIITHFGRHRLIEDIRPQDFSAFREKLAKNRNPNTLSNEIGRIRAIFNYAGPKGLAWVPDGITYGPMFRKPSR